MSECVHDFVSMRIAATVDMCQLCGVPEPAYTIAKLKAELAALREGVEKNAEIYCEGWCKESGGRGCFEDCSGCQIYAPLLEVKDD